MKTNKSQNIVGPYLREFGGAMVLYVIVLFSSIPFRDSAEPGVWKILLSLLPVIPLILVFWAIIRMYNRLDEMMQRAQSEAFALGAILLGFTMTFWGFAETGGFPELPTIWVGPLLFGFWGISLPIVLRRYR